MLAVVALSLALQVLPGAPSKPVTREDSLKQRRRDSLSVVIEEAIAASSRDRRPPRRDSVTPELERSAFRDQAARDLLYKARDARVRQDSGLQSYEAKTYQRISVGLGFRAVGRSRLLFRTEVASRVRWSRSGGAVVDITGERAVAPMVAGSDIDSEMQGMSPVPYYPGRESLWIGGDGLARAEVDDRELVHPLATGSEAYYTYSIGDSLIFTLPDNSKITLRELRIEPRRPEWKLSVGSFWFDAASGQLVRAAYRFSAPMDIWAVAKEESKRHREDPSRDGGMTDLRELEEEDDIPAIARAMMSPLKANLEGVTIEYGLFGGRFWLPRTQYAIANAQAGFMRVPVKIEESFSYASVNGPDVMPAVPPPPMTLRDSLFPGDTSWRHLSREERRERNRTIARAAAQRAEQRQKAREAECASSGFYTRSYDRYEGTLRTAVRMPCDSAALVNSPDLAESIYDPGEELFGVAERDELLNSLGFSLQSGWAPQPIIWDYGLGMTRYNRVEGFSTGFAGSTNLGKGYAADGSFRIGTGDWSPNVELGGSRSNGRTTWRLGGYKRLSVVSDWGAPLSFGASLGALIFGRDDGYYYRSAGADLTRTTTGGTLTTRFFAEHQWEADVNTSFSVANSLGSAAEFGENVVATRGNVAGVALRDLHSFGLDPQGWRALTDLRLEGGWFAPEADSLDADLYGRAGLDVTISKGIGERWAASVTAGAGVAQKPPVQRLFPMGGTETVRGQRPGTQSGDAYWLTRLEIGRGFTGAKLVGFGDLGWAGPRSEFSKPGRPMSGAGIGASFMDGLIRSDLAWGIYPTKRLRFDLYLEARF